MRELRSRRSRVDSRSKVSCSLSSAPFLPFRTAATGMNDSLGRRPSRTSPVGPFGPMTKWRSGCSYGKFRIGLSNATTSEPPRCLPRVSTAGAITRQSSVSGCYVNLAADVLKPRNRSAVERLRGGRASPQQCG